MKTCFCLLSTISTLLLAMSILPVCGSTVCFTKNGVKGICLSAKKCKNSGARGTLFTKSCPPPKLCCPNPVTASSSQPQVQKRQQKNRLKRTARTTTTKRPRTTKTKPTTVRITTKTTTRAPPAPLVGPVPNLRVKGCGVRRTVTDFVVGGKDADFWPWMAAVFIKAKDKPNFNFHCGATVISRRYILTAAHCLLDGTSMVRSNRVTVRVGGITQRGDGHVYKVHSIKIPKSYRSYSHNDDIALLHLVEDLHSKRVREACLPSPGWYNSTFYKRNGTVIGWGFTTDGGVLSSTLKEAVVPIVSNKKCDSKYKKLGSMSLPRGITENFICAGTEDGSVDTCQGDSGGPLLISDQSSKWVVAGVVSFGYGCADPDYPGVYTRVAKYLPWIRDNSDIPPKNS